MSGLHSDGLSFSVLRQANERRAPQFKNSKGELTHPNGVQDWSPEKWFTALSGEVGELGNFIKKNFRGDLSEEQFMEEAKKEIADVQIYLDLLSARLGIDIGKVVISKFNEVSEKVGSEVFIREDGSDYCLKLGKEVPANG